MFPAPAQTLHFNSVLIDPHNNTGAVAINTKHTNWNDYFTRAKERVSSSVPIVLPATAFYAALVYCNGSKQIRSLANSMASHAS